jgi:hypothetical protein
MKNQLQAFVLDQLAGAFGNGFCHNAILVD